MQGMGKAARLRRQHKKQAALDAEKSKSDPRLNVTTAKHIPGAPRSRLGYKVVVVEQFEDSSGETVVFNAPQATLFNLYEAKRFLALGEDARKSAHSKIVKRSGGTYKLTNDTIVMEALTNLTAAVLFSYAAIEAFANHTIGQLDDSETATDAKGKILAKEEMIFLSMEAKLADVLPKHPEVSALDKGREPWQNFTRLKKIRDELVHLKHRAKKKISAADNEETTAYGWLLRGEASTCADDAIALIDGLRPGFVSDEIKEMTIDQLNNGYQSEAEDGA